MKHLNKFAAIGIAAALALPSLSFAALKVGTRAPDFSAPAFLAGKPFTFKLADALKKGPVVVYFFPATSSRRRTPP
jgi:peroxiredoxin Q/BCP